MKDQSITELIGLGSVIAFVLTVLYMYGYQHGSGINLFLYFSVNDYFRQAIVWLTPTIYFRWHWHASPNALA
jgi:amino acid permease